MMRGTTHLPLMAGLLRERVFPFVLVTTSVMTTVVVAYSALASRTPFGWDAIAYLGAARAWLEGGNPWASAFQAGFGPVQYAAPPTSFLPYVPFAWMPEWIVAAVWVGLNAWCALWVMRRLDLPRWWLLFTPVSLAIMTGGTALPTLALLVRGGTLAQALAVVLRVYLAVPLVILGRWRPLLTAAVIIALTLPMWIPFIQQYGAISDVLASQAFGGTSATGVPFLIPVAVVCLILLGRERAAWLAIPALWPATQEYYAVIALPVIASSPWVALSLVPIDIPGAIVAGLAAQVLWERIRVLRAARLRARGTTREPALG